MVESAPAPKRLLIIDDDDGLREVFRLFMEKAGFQVAEAEDGEKGLAKIPEFKPDLIVLDLMMPNLNGFEFVQKAQALGIAGIPIIIISGYSYSEKVQDLRKQPQVVDFLKKPIRYSELADAIRKLLTDRKA